MNLTEQNHEQGIDRTLKALSSAHPPEGMHDRILARLAQAEQETATARPRNIFTMPWLAGGFALAGALALCIALATRTAHHPPTPPTTAAVEPQERPVSPGIPLAPIDAARRALPPSVSVASTKRPAPSVQPVAEPELASFPAPEAPLTEQEKLLLHIAHHPGPAEFELLNPEARDQIAQANRNDFNQFFPAPTSQEIYYAQHQPQP